MEDTFAEDRRAGLGGSDFPKLMIPGYKYGGAYDVYLDKIEGSTFTGNNATRRGHYMEPCVAQWYSDTTGRILHHVSPEADPGLKLARVGKEWTLVHPEFDFIRGTPDYLTDDPDLGYEGKTANERQLDMVDQFGDPLWGHDGSDIVPLPYLIQCQEYMGLTGRRRWDLGCFFVGNKDEFRLYHLTFDPEFYAQLVETGVAFWNDHIIPRVPPPIDLIPSSMVVEHLLNKALAGGAEMRATPGLEALAEDWAALQAQRLNIVDDEDEIKGEFARLMGALGAAKVKGTTRSGKNWSVGASEGKSGTTTNKDAVIAIYQRRLMDLGVSGEELEAILNDNTIPTETAASIRPYFNSINKDRKALRAAAKASPLSKDISA
jgi:predicted phage-related endonuclease